LLLSINMKFVSPVPRENSCEITSTKTVNLSRIDKVTLLSTSPGSKTSKEKSFTLNINCEQKSTGNTIYYWFNPRSSTDGTPGVLLNSDSTSSGGAQNVNTIIKENGIPVNFYDYEAKSFIVDANKLNKEINLTADYYRTTDDITIGTVRGLLEVVIQEE
ncbi:TPA: fimbrial protein, partial [Klebsiella pneumoniae subsp. ozaenae]|nr:fimbrial protein [Klebsiella pneumoniae]HDT0651948.1 fimbrial protein [Klebsiella pneumoniae subsp. ozaenae]HDU5054865.1 fimbrial protein [Klebsiella pneumoniae subsp. pneumoniae]HBZ0958356.1 fimbrial protein [Klebsiella pneumoniae]HDO6831899.1 fimbrial protein [Klebsiella pneumoniae]